MLPAFNRIVNGILEVVETVTEGGSSDEVNAALAEVVDDAVNMGDDFSAEDLMSAFLKLNINDPNNDPQVYDFLFKRIKFLRQEIKKTRKLLESHLDYLEGQLSDAIDELVQSQQEFAKSEQKDKQEYMELMQAILEQSNEAADYITRFLIEYTKKKESNNDSRQAVGGRGRSGRNPPPH